MTLIPIIRTKSALGAQRNAWAADGASIALVPTMGALHEGHLTLVREARRYVGPQGRVIVSIFVNPAQFAPHEDFDHYPRDLAADAAKLETSGGADFIYAPDASEIYPDGFAARIHIDGPASGLESEARPHFFSGVATVVAKLFLQVKPGCAFFGEKDYQQLLVVKQLVRDLDLGIEIVGVPIVREADGLALSSRNAYLSAHDRQIAGTLNRVLQGTATMVRKGTPIERAEHEAASILKQSGFSRVDYVAIRDAETLEPVKNLDRPARILAASVVGRTRLIDNMPV